MFLACTNNSTSTTVFCSLILSWKPTDRYDFLSLCLSESENETIIGCLLPMYPSSNCWINCWKSFINWLPPRLQADSTESIGPLWPLSRFVTITSASPPGYLMPINQCSGLWCDVIFASFMFYLFYSKLYNAWYAKYNVCTYYVLDAIASLHYVT